MKKVKVSVWIKCYALWLLQVIAYPTPWRNITRVIYLKAFIEDWLGEKT